MTVPASETRRVWQAIGGDLREEVVFLVVVVVISCEDPVRLDVLLTACLTSSAAMPPVCTHGHKCLDTVLVTAVPREPLESEPLQMQVQMQMQTVTASRNWTDGRTTAGSAVVVVAIAP